jgi:hypothetical protein
MNTEAMLTEDKSKRAMMDAAKLADDLRMEQEMTIRSDGERKMMEAQVKDLQVLKRKQMHCFFPFRSASRFCHRSQIKKATRFLFVCFFPLPSSLLNPQAGMYFLLSRAPNYVVISLLM